MKILSAHSNYASPLASRSEGPAGKKQMRAGRTAEAKTPPTPEEIREKVTLHSRKQASQESQVSQAPQAKPRGPLWWDGSNPPSKSP